MAKVRSGKYAPLIRNIALTVGLVHIRAKLPCDGAVLKDRTLHCMDTLEKMVGDTGIEPVTPAV